MVSSIQGFGTNFYGKRDFCAADTDITKERIILLWIPILPLRSFRVMYRGSGQSVPYTIGMPLSHTYSVYEKTYPNWKLALSVYGFVVLIVSWAICAAFLVIKFQHFGGVSDSIAGLLWVLALARTSSAYAYSLPSTPHCETKTAQPLLN